MTRRLMLTMAVIAAGACTVVLLLLRPAPRAAEAPATAPPTATAPAAATAPATTAPATASVATATAVTPAHAAQSGPAPLPPGVKLQSGHPSGSPVPPEEVPPMPLEQRLEKAAQMASVLE